MYNLSIDELRNICRQHIESFEYWARRLIDTILSNHYGQDYINYKNSDESNLINNKTKSSILSRYTNNPSNFTRIIDATLIEDIVCIITNPKLYNAHFKKALVHAYPNGVEEAKFFLNKLISPRNSLYHANPISVRQIEQCICYSNDFIDSIKEYYREENSHMSYNVPQIIKIKDSLGREIHRSRCVNSSTGIIWADNNFIFSLRPGDKYHIEIEVDPAFNSDEYNIKWDIKNNEYNDFANKEYFDILLKNIDVSESFYINCKIISNKDWHKHGTYDDCLRLCIKVLPPI